MTILVLRSNALAGAVVACISLAHGGAARADVSAAEPPPTQIFNGEEAAECAFPSAVGMISPGGSLFCTGTLIHPQLVLFAAHCMDTTDDGVVPSHIIFGEDSALPVKPIPVEDCQLHPAWFSDGIDLAACTLPVAVRHVPIAPVIMGCEVDALHEDTMLTIVGFGATHGIIDEQGETTTQGVGRKRFTQQRVTDVLVDANDVVMIGPDTGGCFGDSGGPAFVQLPDGTWRVIGAASTLHPPASPRPAGQICGLGTVYEIAWNHMEWLEGFAGFDLTPCHDTSGAWNPGPHCGGFPLAPGNPESTWDLGCEATQLGAWSSTCGEPFSTGPFPLPGPIPPPPPPIPPPAPPPPPPPPPDPTPTTSDSDSLDPTLGSESETGSETELDGPGGDKDAGCACRQTSTTPAPLALLLLLGFARRKRFPRN